VKEGIVMKIGVLSLQGAVAEHMRGIEQSGAEALEIKRVEQLDEIHGLIIPGGESTTIGHLMRLYGFIDAIQLFSEQGKPVFGTCAGLIVIAKEIEGQDVRHLQLMDITVRRNAFGRQVASFEVHLDISGIEEPVKGVFIRAPLISSVGLNVEVLATHNQEIVAAREGHLLVTSFHPELTDDFKIHQYFVAMVKETQGRTIQHQV
jgi:5'-phosphate synthase pdxT subunit